MNLIPLLLLLALDCHPVGGDRILGKDLATASTKFSGLPPNAVLAAAPLPGARRVLSVAELAAIARSHQIEGDGFEPICLERETAPLDPLKVVDAMRKSLGMPDLDVQIVELSRFAVAPGEIVFPREALPPAGADGAGIWKGYVSYGSGRQSIWANVRLSATVRRVVATADVPAGRALRAVDIRVEELRDFPTRQTPVTETADAAGKVARRPIRAGATLFAADLVEPNAVERGQTVLVEVRSGAALLKIEATAESAGRAGDTIPLRNRISGQVFRAEVKEKGRAVLALPAVDESPK
jgi:flagella basal body P-ring formation protein FlgA